MIKEILEGKDEANKFYELNKDRIGKTAFDANGTELKYYYMLSIGSDSYVMAQRIKKGFNIHAKNQWEQTEKSLILSDEEIKILYKI